MQLYHSPTSPYVRKVVVTALLTNTYKNIEVIPATLSPLVPSAQVQRVNPLGKIPALVLDDGSALFDSPVICEYLNTLGKLANSSPVDLVPSSGPERWIALKLNALADGLLEAAMAIRAESMRPEQIHFEPWTTAQRIKVDNAIKALDSEAAVSLKKLSLGSIAAGCALGWIDFRMPQIDWRAGAPQLTSWYEGFAAEPFMQQTQPKT